MIYVIFTSNVFCNKNDNDTEVLYQEHHIIFFGYLNINTPLILEILRPFDRSQRDLPNGTLIVKIGTTLITLLHPKLLRNGVRVIM